MDSMFGSDDDHVEPPIPVSKAETELEVEDIEMGDTSLVEIPSSPIFPSAEVQMESEDQIEGKLQQSVSSAGINGLENIEEASENSASAPLEVDINGSAVGVDSLPAPVQIIPQLNGGATASFSIPDTHVPSSLSTTDLLKAVDTPLSTLQPAPSLIPTPSTSTMTSAAIAPPQSVAAQTGSRSSLAKRSPPLPSTLTLPVGSGGLAGMTPKEVRQRFNGYKIVAVLALNVELIR